MIAKTEDKTQSEKKKSVIDQLKEIDSKSGTDKIQRSPHDRENPYVMINKKVAMDTSISAECTRMLIFLLAKPNNWDITVKNLHKDLAPCGIGRDKIYRLIKEATEAGYMMREDILINGRRDHCIYYVSEEAIYRGNSKNFARVPEKRNRADQECNILSNEELLIYKEKVVKERTPPPDPKPKKPAKADYSLSSEQRQILKNRLGEERLKKYEEKIKKYTQRKRSTFDLINAWANEDDNKVKKDLEFFKNENKKYLSDLIKNNPKIKKEIEIYNNYIEFYPKHVYTVAVSFSDSDFTSKVNGFIDRMNNKI